MKHKIVLLALDERPCNASFPCKLFGGNQVQVVSPARLGQKKSAANVDEIIHFLQQECRDADGLILSMDMLLYGGLLPSRIHTLSAETVQKRMDVVRQLRRANPRMQIYAFQCIMRCPAYSSNDEEPDYYADYGAEIHRSGDIKHRYMLGLCDDKVLDAAMCKIPPQALKDYLGRRAFNLNYNKKALDLVREGVIDFMVIPQDDSARYGYTALDQQDVRGRISELHLQTRVLMYPGADEVALTLMSRMMLHFNDCYPGVYVKYAATAAPGVIPAYEDRTLAETMKYHLLAAGCHQVDSAAQADLVIAVSCPAGEMKEAVMQPVRNSDYCVERNLTEFVQYIRDCICSGLLVSVCDNAYANGGDLELIDLMDQLQVLDGVSGYAGWNTSANTLGTAIAEGVYALLYGHTRQFMDFLALRYLEDVGYCSVVRRYITENCLESLDMDYFDIKEQRGAISQKAHALLTVFAEEKLSSISRHLVLEDVRMPWSRMFETDLTAHWVP